MASRTRTAPGLRIEVVDTTQNGGAAGMRVDVFTLGARARKLCGGVVNTNGVVEAPVLASAAISPGEYEVVFHIGEYFRGRRTAEEGPSLDTVPFRFTIPRAQPYLLQVRVTPWGFSLASIRDSGTCEGCRT